MLQVVQQDIKHFTGKSKYYLGPGINYRNIRLEHGHVLCRFPVCVLSYHMADIFYLYEGCNVCEFVCLSLYIKCWVVLCSLRMYI